MNRRVVTYAIVIAASLGIIGGLIRLGEIWFSSGVLVTAGQVAGRAPAHSLERPLVVLISQLLIVVFATQVVGKLATLVNQPSVIGEIAAGLLLGPSFFGGFWPDAFAFVFPADSLGSLRLLSQLGVILFMFTVGLELDARRLRHQAPIAVAVSHFSIVVPFALGVMMALLLFTRYAPPGVPFESFALFMGIALSITAFPVLARILEERGLTRTALGATSIACAAVDDVTAWTLLALVVTWTTAGGIGTSLLFMAGAIIVFVMAMIRVVRPLLARWIQVTERGLSRPLTALVLMVLLGSALVTELIGIHALFGAFVAGVVMPASAEVRHQLRERLESISSVFLLPVFFAFTGLRTEIGLLNDVTSWIICASIIVVATAGKLVGSMLAARWTGATWRDAFVLGALMNTRGLMELIALNVGYDLGILSPQMFTMLVVMALVTTAMTGPLVDLGWKPQREELEPAH
jgi:Kef-type K+ transport system membrane component KefB